MRLRTPEAASIVGLVAKKWGPYVAEAVIVLIALGFGVAGGVVGWVIGHETGSSGTGATSVVAQGPQGHVGAGLPAHEFGNPSRGAKLFVSKGCADCHSYAGKGGTDAPPLDFMSGHLSAREIANMSGQIWNHLPVMLHHFKDENLAVPTFTGYEMADLIAYLHSKGQGGAGMQGGDTTGETQMGSSSP